MMKLWLVLLSLVTGAMAQQSRPVGVPDSLPCSPAIAGDSLSMGIGNAYDGLVEYFKLDDKCQQVPVNAIVSGATQFLTVNRGDSYYARNATGYVIDIFTVNGQTWVIQDKKFPPPSNTDGAQKPSPSVGTGDANTSSTGTNQSTIIAVSVVTVLVLIVMAIVSYVLILRKRKRAASTKAIENKLTPPVSPSPINSPWIVAGKSYRILQAHESIMPDELTVLPGDMVRVHAVYDDGWIYASLEQLSSFPVDDTQFINRRPGAQGMIPAGCLSSVTFMPPSTLPRTSQSSDRGVC